MDKETLSNYGWIVICVLVLAVMVALATPFGKYIEAGVLNTTDGLISTSQNALDVIGLGNAGGSGNTSDSTPTEPTPEQPTEPETPATFTFLLDGNTYTADEGMTWALWCNSSYNANGYVLNGSNVESADGNAVDSVLSSDLITADTTYTVTEALPAGWADLISASEDGSYESKYIVGDTVTLTMKDSSTAQFRIVGIDHDDLADGTGKAHLTLISENTLVGHNMNSTATNSGGWRASDMKTYLNGDYMNTVIPDAVASSIKSVTKKSFDYNGGSGISQTTSDKLWIPSYTEVGYTINSTITKAEGGSAYKYFTSDAKRTKTGIYSWWRLRSAHSGNSEVFWGVSSNGDYNVYDANFTGGVALGFCI